MKFKTSQNNPNKQYLNSKYEMYEFQCEHIYLECCLFFAGVCMT